MGRYMHNYDPGNPDQNCLGHFVLFYMSQLWVSEVKHFSHDLYKLYSDAVGEKSS